VDNLITGSIDNIGHLIGRPNFRFVNQDVSDGIWLAGDFDAILHLASPASPLDYMQFPIHTLKVGALGTHNALGFALAKGARFLLASTSEVYGDPLVHPQREDYWGNVNPTGLRGVYDEAKRFAEAITLAYHRYHAVDTRIARIFNTIGERMRPRDGRAVPAFVTAALAGEPLTVHGDGSQTRSIGHVSDLVEGIVRLLASDVVDPVNLGNPHEVSITEVARMVIALTGSHSELLFVDRPVDDPTVRQPDITRARKLLGWEPKVTLEDALKRTIEWFRSSAVPRNARQPEGS
jgi:dTDP-glucose 4,6-dehydratase